MDRRSLLQHAGLLAITTGVIRVSTSAEADDRTFGELLRDSLLSKDELLFLEQNPDFYSTKGLPDDRIASLREQCRRMAMFSFTGVLKQDDFVPLAIVVVSRGRFFGGEIAPRVSLNESFDSGGVNTILFWVRCQDEDPEITVQSTAVRYKTGTIEPVEVLTKARRFQLKDDDWLEVTD